MRFITISILAVLISSFCLRDKECVKGDIEYSVASYADEPFLKPQYQKTFDSIFQKKLVTYFCNREIKNIPTIDKNRKGSAIPSLSIIIEPLFVDLDNFDGIYGQRIYSLKPKSRNPRFTCGYFHYLFIISNNEFIELTSDSTKNETLIRTHLKDGFSEDELLKMTTYYKHGTICDSYTFLPPDYIKNDSVIIFNIND